MSQKEQTLSVEIPASQIEDLSRFESMRLRAYAAESDVVKQRELSTLVGNAQLTGGIALTDVVLEVLTRPEEHLERAMSRLEKIGDSVATKEAIKKHKKLTYKVSLDEGGEVLGVDKIVPIPLDKKATKRSQRISDTAPYGRKQNGSSFRTSEVLAERRH